MWTKVMRRKNTLSEYDFEAGKFANQMQRGVPATSARNVGREYLIRRTQMMRQEPLGPPERKFVQRRKVSILNAYGVIGKPEVPAFGDLVIGPKHGRSGQNAEIKRHKSGFLKRRY